MTQNNIVINGVRIGRIRASVLLLKETFRFLSADKEMLAIPIVALAVQLFFLGVVTLILFSTGMLSGVEQNETMTNPAEFATVFLWYIVSAFMLAWTQAAIAHTVYVRAHGGNATLGEAMHVAFQNWSALLLWSVITSTVGILLRAIAERSQLLMRIVTAIIGTAWSVLTYFVVPSIVIGKRPAFAAIRDSGSVFKQTWGETLVTNVSFSLVFTLAFIAYGIVLIGLGFLLGSNIGSLLFLGILAILGIVVLALMSATLGSILRTLLYIYASEQVAPQNFNKELLSQMLVKRTSSVMPEGSGTSFVQ
jgi:hypothetical protein